MAGIYFIVEKGGTTGYVGLDSNMTSTYFPRLYDHVFAAYHLGREYRNHQEGDVRDKIQSCEEKMNELLPCSFDYRILQQGRDCYGLGVDKFQEFSTIGETKGSLPEMNGAEIYYIYEFKDRFAKLNDVWGGKYSLALNIGKDVDLGKGIKFFSVVKNSKTKTTWFPNRNMGTDDNHMKRLFFPFVQFVDDVVDYYVDKYILKDIVNQLYDVLSKKSNGNDFINNNTSPTYNKNEEGIQRLYNTIKNIVPQKDYILMDYDTFSKDLGDKIDNAIIEVLQYIKDTIDGVKKKLGKKSFNIQVPTQGLCKTNKQLPFGWPTTNAFHKSKDVTKEIKQLIPEKIFPYIVANSRRNIMGVGLDDDDIRKYLQGTIRSLAEHSNYLNGFYYPARNLGLDYYEGSIDMVVEQEGSEETILIHRQAWAANAYEKLKRSAFESSRDLKELLVG